MGTRLRIGVVGLGSIAQKAWLPVLGAAESWTLQAAWSPGKEKALRICETWRMPYADSLDALAAQCDAVFVHTSTASHYEVVNHLLNAGVHVCVDKPLADKLSEAETLVELAARRRLTLMVGFNRRFAPLYRELKGRLGEAASLRMDKHRSDSVGNDLRFTLLDDYLHVVDTALWLADGQARLRGGALKIARRAKCSMPNISSVRPGCRSPPACIVAQAASASGCRRSRMAGYMPSARCANGRRSAVMAWSSARLPAGKPPLSSAALLAARAILSNACKIRQFLKLQANRRCWLSGSLRNCGATPLANNPL